MRNEHRNILLTKITAAQNEVAHSYHSVRGLYFLAVVFAATIGVISFSLCGETHSETDNACQSNYIALKKLTGLEDGDVIYTGFESDVRCI